MDTAKKAFSKAALDCAFFECGWFCFEEDCAATVALRELMDKGLFTAPVNEYYAPGEYEKLIDGSVQRYYCYVREWLDRHLKQAERGIRFITPHYEEKFRIPDGDKIRITSSWGQTNDRTCRYIDEYHLGRK